MIVLLQIIMILLLITLYQFGMSMFTIKIAMLALIILDIVVSYNLL